MKTFRFFQITLAVTLVALFFTFCKKEEGPDVRAEILKAITTADSLASLALASDDPAAGFQDIADDLEQLEWVEKVVLDGNELHVSFKQGGWVSWADIPTLITPPYALKRKSLEAEIINDYPLDGITTRGPGLVGNQKVCLINATANDEKFAYAVTIINYLNTTFQSAGFDVTEFNGASANLNLYASGWDDYGTIINIGHAGISDGLTWLTTGQAGNYIDLVDNYLDDWDNDRIGISKIKEKVNGQPVNKMYFKVSSKFFDDRYADGSFANSIVDLTSCQAFRLNDLKSVLNKNGAQAIIGWNQSVGGVIGPHSGALLFYHMLSGKNLSEAYALLPADAISYTLANGTISTMNYYPQPSADEARLIEEENEFEIVISSPVNGAQISSRTVNIQGRIENAASLTSGILTVNGAASKLEVDGSFYFDQNILLQSGANQIEITATGTHTNGQPASGTAKLTLNASFAPLPLWTRLVWNTDLTDVDFHLLRPGYTFDELFSSADCYYSNKNTSWGAYLDVDDVNGRGPEHITIPATPLPGVYTLVVHYYDSHDGTHPQFFVQVETLTDKFESNPLSLANSYVDTNDGDAYAVCTIEYPSGIITPIEARIATPRSAEQKKIPKKIILQDISSRKRK